MGHPVLRAEGLSYLVCSTQRSGSSLLCELLKGSEVAGVPDEYFETLRSTGIPRQARQYFEAPGLQEVVDRLPPLKPGRPEAIGEFEGWFRYALQRGTSRNGVFGAKMMWNYLDDFRDRVRELPGLQQLSFTQALDEIFPNLRIIFVRRRDKVAQAVSLWKAIQTEQWRAEGSGESERAAEYNYRALKHLVTELHRWDASWEDWFHATGREPIRVIYEEFVNSRASTVGRLLDALGVDPPEVEGEKGPLRRQANDLSRNWVEQFRQDDASDQLTA